MQPQQSPYSNLRQQYAFAQWLMQFPALTLMTILRRDLGFRIVNPLSLVVVTGGLVAIAVLAEPGNPDARPFDLIVFAAVSFLFGVFQRLKRRMELNRGVRQHSGYIGSSPFDFRWLPMFCRRNRRIARYVDPIFCLLIGLALFPISRALSCWIVFAAFCLRAFEHATFCQHRQRNLDLIDSMIVSEMQAEFMEQYERPDNSQHYAPAPPLPSGPGNDIDRRIKHQKAAPGRRA